MVSIIIVNYNSGEFLDRCILSVINSVKIEWEIIVVDNSSSDCSILNCKKYAKDNPVRIIVLEKNIGFSGANNVGAKAAQGNILHFLNPDTALLSTMDNIYRDLAPDCISVNPWINRDNKFVIPQNKIPTVLNYLYFLFIPQKCKYWYTGASVLMSKEIYDKIGGWNEAYFLYAEDLDLFYKAHVKGIGVKLLLNTPIYHYVGGCSSSIWNSYQRELKVQTSFKLFYEINNISGQYLIMKIILLLKSLKYGFDRFRFEVVIWVNLRKMKPE